MNEYYKRPLQNKTNQKKQTKKTTQPQNKNITKSRGYDQGKI